MAFMVDRGDSYRVEFLGSTMLTQMGTGLGVLQKPLRELYFRFKQAGKNCKLQERILTMTGKGVRVSYHGHGAASGPQEMFYGVPSIILWDAVRFVTIRGSDKKQRAAFEPLDNDHSRNKDNLFSSLDKKYSFLQQMPHPAIFACVFRRTQGVKSLDVHAFVCRSDEEALGLVGALNLVQRHYSDDEVQESGVFGYNPFNIGAGVRTPGVAAPPAGSPGDLLHGDPGRNPHLAQSRSHDGISGSRSEIGRSGPQRDNPQQREPRPGAIPLPGFQQGQGRSSESPRPGCLQLTQGDFSKASRPVSGGEPQAWNSLRESSQPERNYQYTPVVDREVVGPGRYREDSASSLGSQSPHTPLNQQLPGRQRQSSEEPPAAFYYGQVTDGGRQADVNRPGNAGNMGQGYSLLAANSGFEPRSDPTQVKGRRRDGSPTGYQHTIAKTLPKDASRHSTADALEFNDRLKLMGSGQRQSYVEQRPLSNVSPKVHRTASANQLANAAVSPSSSNQPPARQVPVFAESSSEHPNRPIAKVPPHKIQGVKVLPTEMTLQNQVALSQNNLKKTNSNHLHSDQAELSRNPSGQRDSLRDVTRTPSQQSNDSYHSPPQHPPKQANGWQSKPQSAGSSADREDPASETLLARQKKDAEIAADVQDIHFDYESTTMSPHGTNFEKSLGYFP